MFILRLLLLPITFLYSLVMRVRNWMYDRGILHATKVPVKVISIGNIAIGGTGKSPLVIYLHELLSKTRQVALLSRGYKRKTKGFQLVKPNSSVDQIGDEPKQFSQVIPDLKMAVCEDRVEGANKLLNTFPEVNTIILDDAYQHRAIDRDINILLIDYASIGQKEFVLPTGNLREPKTGSKRADAVVISKTPSIFSPIERRRITEMLKLYGNQHLFFSYIEFKDIYPFSDAAKLLSKDGFDITQEKVIALSGIANNATFIDHLSRFAKDVEIQPMPDHHHYDVADLVELEKKCFVFGQLKKIIVTTEKDIAKLSQDKFLPIIKTLPIFVLPIEVKFHEEENISFDKYILDHVGSN